MSLSEYEAAATAFDTTQTRLDVLTREAESAELNRLALLSPLEYGRERTTTAKRLTIPVGLLDKEIGERQRTLLPATASGNGQPLHLPELEPAADPVNGRHLVTQLLSTLERYVILPAHAALAISLWIIRAHADDCFDISPRLALLSPEKRCGKTTLLELIAKLVPRAMVTSNVSPSTVFRSIEAAHPTLLIDEMDSFNDKHEEFRGILNSGHRREAAQVHRTVGDDHEPRTFSTWCPMVLAAIGHLPDTIEDRSVIIPMRRKAPGETVEDIRWVGRAGKALRHHLKALGRGAARWALDHKTALQECEPTIPATLNDRAADNWSPLLAIAEVIGGDWVAGAQAAAVALSGESDTDTASTGIRLLEDIRALFQEKACDRIGSKELCDYLAELEERPWGQWGRLGKPINPAQLAKLLRVYRIESRTIRTASDTFKGYYADFFTDTFSRYLAPVTSLSSLENHLPNRHSVTKGHQSGDEVLFEKVTDRTCDVSNNDTNPAPRADCDGVTAQNGLFWGEEEIWEDNHAH